eukprot:gnl/Spiro4/29595_TR14504_c0_g1_i1.p1 gnl/Spiro4/29595_TR14504_c0_g1~~gnl/Spiro4/29595_TR14504_c0_g1_i1.p1  ORF type:complete len:270 (+),score=30.34 gnl/Spiro4/29595_TR14504_c0_g1_i1:143-952(+)
MSSLLKGGAGGSSNPPNARGTRIEITELPTPGEGISQTPVVSYADFELRIQNANSKINLAACSPKDLSEKVIVIGDGSVGKSSLVKRACHNEFQDNYKATIGMDLTSQQFAMNGVEFALSLWDTAGQERGRSLSGAFYRGAVCVVLVFDVGNRTSFTNVRMWLAEVEKVTNRKLALFLVGTKSDIPTHVISFGEATALASEINAEYFEVSSKTDQNVKPLFKRMAFVVLTHLLAKLEAQRGSLQSSTSNSAVVNLDEIHPSSTSGGCSC